VGSEFVQKYLGEVSLELLQSQYEFLWFGYKI